MIAEMTTKRKIIVSTTNPSMYAFRVSFRNLQTDSRCCIRYFLSSCQFFSLLSLYHIINLYVNTIKSPYLRGFLGFFHNLEKTVPQGLQCPQGPAFSRRFAPPQGQTWYRFLLASLIFFLLFRSVLSETRLSVFPECQIDFKRYAIIIYNPVIRL